MTLQASVFPDGALRGASGQLARTLSKLAVSVSLAKGRALFEQGDPGDAIYAVIEGMLEVSVMSLDGRKLTLNTLGPGDVFGEIALFDDGPRTASVSARSDCVLGKVSRAVLLEEILRRPEIAADLLALAGRRLRWISDTLEEATFLQLSPRLARRLLHLRARFADPSGKLSFSQADLADQVGVTREAVARVLADWRKRGWIEGGRGWVRVTDATAIAEESERGIL